LTQVHQFLPSYATGDAVSGHTVRARQILREMGFESEIFAERSHGADPDASVLPLDAFERRGDQGDTWLLYQHSIGSRLGRFLLDRPERLVVNYHNVTPASFFEPWDLHIAAELALGRRHTAMLAPRAAAGIAVSVYNEQELRDAGFQKTAVAPVLFDVDSLRRDVDETALAQRMAAKDGGGADIVFVGRVAPHKAQHDLVRAVAAYRKGYDSSARLHLVGARSSERYWSALQAFIDDAGLHDAVTLTGAVSAGELGAYYRSADLFLCLSEHEGFCVPLLEAMANDVPVVGYAAAAVPETLAGAGVLIDGKDAATVAAAMHLVLGDGKRRDALVDAGRRRLAAFAPDVLRRRFEDAIREVVR
jgi:glycosyltransferase involved in cell wall biosynthesis